MAAAAFKASVKVTNDQGASKVYYLTCSDVNAAAWVFPSAGTELSVSSRPAAITDLVLSAAGTE